MGNVFILEYWMNNIQYFFIAKNFNALKHKSIVFLCIQYTKHIGKLEIYGSSDVRFERVLEQIGYIPLWNINVRQNLILWLVALYPYLNMQQYIPKYFIALKRKSICSFFLSDSDSPY